MREASPSLEAGGTVVIFIDRISGKLAQTFERKTDKISAIPIVGALWRVEFTLNGFPPQCRS